MTNRNYAPLRATRQGLLGFAASALIASGAYAQESNAPTLVLEGVTVVDTRDGQVTPGQSLVIVGDRIERIVPAGTADADGAEIVDASGKFVVPGYLDMHSHALTSGNAASNLALLLAHGVTGFRQMSGADPLLARRKQVPSLTPPGMPDVLMMPGDLVTGASVRTPEDAASFVARQKELGADFIKVLDTNAAAYMALLEEAAKAGIPVAGHLPPSVSLEKAIEAGIHAIEHLGPRESMLLGCSTEEGEMRDEIAQTPPPQPPAPGTDMAAVFMRMIANPIIFTSTAQFGRMIRVVDTFDEARCTELAHSLRDNEVWQVPTLIRLRTMAMGDDPAYRNDPNLVYVTAEQRQFWEAVAVQFSNAIDADTKQALARGFEQHQQLVKLFADEDVPLLAGSDYGGQWVVSGFSLHQEFELLAEAGLSPLQVLQMTTLNGARFLEREDTMGTLEAGKVADIVILDADPLESVANLGRIAGVVRGGIYRDADALEALKQEALGR